MDNAKIIKAGIIFLGGFGLFMLLKPKASDVAKPSSGKKSANGELYPAPSPENAEIVLIAYQDALKNGEPQPILTELNQEMMKEFGMRCYIDQKTGKTVVCDVSGETVLSR
jgi:hypothetical protein